MIIMSLCAHLRLPGIVFHSLARSLPNDRSTTLALGKGGGDNLDMFAIGRRERGYKRRNSPSRENNVLDAISYLLTPGGGRCERFTHSTCHSWGQAGDLPAGPPALSWFSPFLCRVRGAEPSTTVSRTSLRKH